MKLNLIETHQILNYEKQIGYELVVTERPAHLNLSRFYVSFEHCEILDGGFLNSTSGQGGTINEALVDYCSLISNKIVVFDAYKPERKTVQLPTLIHSNPCDTN